MAAEGTTQWSVKVYWKCSLNRLPLNRCARLLPEADQIIYVVSICLSLFATGDAMQILGRHVKNEDDDERHERGAGLPIARKDRKNTKQPTGDNRNNGYASADEKPTTPSHGCHRTDA